MVADVGTCNPANVRDSKVEVKSMRFTALLASSLMLSACADMWETQAPMAPPGGTGISVDNEIVSGPDAVSSISQLPDRNRAGSLPPFATQGTAAAYEFGRGYRVGAGDKLAIKVVGETELTGEYVVDATGVLSMPYVQSVPVAGMNTGEIERLIVQRLRAGYLKDPKVSVQATDLRPFYIMGEVSSGGSFPYQPGMTVQNAIAIAGGYGTRADHGVVMITRRNANGTTTLKVPVTTQVYPGDIIFIRERWF
jgi:polysaccharide biosynthesis/export protein